MVTRPNVVVVITHDTGRHIGPYDARVATPNLDRVAREGVLFEQPFSAAPQCSPSRASLLTGLAPHSHGLIGLVHRGFRLAPASFERTLPKVLGAAGYHTALFGFQHEAPEARDLGYDTVVQVPGRQSCAIVALLAAEYLASAPAEPFFAMVGFAETHRLWEPTTTPLDDVQVPPYLPDLPAVRRDVADLNAQVEKVDQAIGAILAALDRLGLAERTLFVYTTDHGLPFPHAKATLFDPGVTISLLARGPGGLMGGKRLGGLVANVDLYTTVLELCGVTPPSGTQGVSLLPLVRGEATKVRDYVYPENNYQNAYDPQRVIRDERFKLYLSFADRPMMLATHAEGTFVKDYFRDQGYYTRPRPREMLFDIAADPLEQRNVAEEPAYQAVRDRLRQDLERWRRETDDPLLHGDLPAPEGARLTPLDSYGR